jgi:hypothetical protein
LISFVKIPKHAEAVLLGGLLIQEAGSRGGEKVNQEGDLFSYRTGGFSRASWIVRLMNIADDQPKIAAASGGSTPVYR